MIVTNGKLQYRGFAFQVPRNTIYQLPEPSYRVVLSTIDGQSTYETICYLFYGDIVTAKQFQAINTIKILLQDKIPQILFIDHYDAQNNHVDKYYHVNELKALISPLYVRYQKPLIVSSKKEIFSSICKYAQRLHYERQLHLEGVLYVSLFLNLKLPISERLSYRDIFKKGVSAYSNVQLDRPQKLFEKDLKIARSEAGAKGGALRGKQKSDETKKRISLIEKYLSSCIKDNGKYDKALLSDLTNIPYSSLCRLLSKVTNVPP